jgi:hypothetical protein
VKRSVGGPVALVLDLESLHVVTVVQNVWLYSQLLYAAKTKILIAAELEHKIWIAVSVVAVL